ncbi:MAG: hypothetical protein CMLOHMNK_00957 [Steroidobacteraceae bacterium]|nr:hypothetical protein [Steroidobacteraceae bacterium]
MAGSGQRAAARGVPLSRPRIEFVQSQRIPWRADVPGLPGPGIEARLLSADDETGARSLVVRYPPGYSWPGGALTVDHEFLVLGGALTIGGEPHPAMTYAHLPAGFDAGARASAAGAVVLEFHSGAPALATQRIAFDERRLVRSRSLYDVPYTGNFHPEFPPGAGRKLLYQDPVTHDTSWVLGTMPLRWAERAEVHPTVEEMYLLAGEVHGDHGVMRPGAYFWRPPSVPHGPFGTLTGNLYFFRTKGGLLATTYVTPARPFRWWPDYDAVLPPELEVARGEVPGIAACW